MKKTTVKLARIPKVNPGKTGADDLVKKKGTKALKKVFKEAETVGGGRKELIVRRCDKIPKKSIAWLWEPYISKGKLTGSVGLPGVGKSFVALSIAASLSNGKLPCSGKACEPINTLYLSYESAPETNTAPRYQAMDGDPRRLFVVDGARGADGKPCAVTLKDVETIEAAINKYKTGFVIIDPLQSFLGADIDMNRANETRPILEALAMVARRTGAAIHIIRHARKDSGGARATNIGLGSQDINANVRSEYFIGTPKDNYKRHALIHIKYNDSERGSSLEYSLEKVTLKDDEDGSPVKVAKVVWHGESTLTVKDLLEAEQSLTKSKTQVERACEWLRDVLGKGPRLIKEMEGEGEFTERVLQKAAIRVGVAKRRRGSMHGPWEWALRPQKFAGTQRKKE